MRAWRNLVTRCRRRNWTPPTSASDRGRQEAEVFDEDLIAILHDELRPVPDFYRLDYLHVYTGTSAIRRDGKGGLRGRNTRGRCGRRWTGGRHVQDHLRGDADLGKLVRYEIRAVTSGTEALGEVTVQLDDKGAR